MLQYQDVICCDIFAQSVGWAKSCAGIAILLDGKFTISLTTYFFEACLNLDEVFDDACRGDDAMSSDLITTGNELCWPCLHQVLSLELHPVEAFLQQLYSFDDFKMNDLNDFEFVHEDERVTLQLAVLCKQLGCHFCPDKLVNDMLLLLYVMCNMILETFVYKNIVADIYVLIILWNGPV